MSRGCSKASCTARFVISLNVTRRMRSGSPSFFFFFFFLPFEPLSLSSSARCAAIASLRGWVRSQIDGIGRQRQLLQPNEDFFFAGNNHVLWLKVVISIHPRTLLGKVLDVPQRGSTVKPLPDTLDGLRLGRRLDDD